MTNQLALSEVALPGVLLLIKVLLKLYLDKTVALPDIVSAIMSLPIDIAFMATSLFSAYLIGRSSLVKEDLAMFLLGILIAAISIILARKCDHFFVRDRYVPAFLICFVNYTTAGVALFFVLSLLSTRVVA